MWFNNAWFLNIRCHKKNTFKSAHISNHHTRHEAIGQSVWGLQMAILILRANMGKHVHLPQPRGITSVVLPIFITQQVVFGGTGLC